MHDSPGPTVVGIVPHTHWDREWHTPFEALRPRLVRLLDTLLERLAREDSYATFLLDGQTVVVDDYLDVRPAATSDIRRLVTEGRLTIGPWMVLMDEFMVSGETVVRDLQMGTRRADALGGAMPVGYLPDMFGHVAQMPQLLRAAGLEHAVVWRGVPAAVERTGFWWEAPDGSRVRAEYLYGSYSNGRDLPDDPEGLIARARAYAEELGPVRPDGGDLLLMNGSDQLLPRPGLDAVAAAANAAQTEYRFEIVSLPGYLDRQPVDSLPVWRGELRSGARANVLMGVASNRVDVHQAAARAERAVERAAEPLAALLLPASDHPHALLDLAWRALVLNSAHDSSCACSADEVVDEVLVRYHRARQIGEAITLEATEALARAVDAPAGTIVVTNPTRPDRDGVVALTVGGVGPVHLVADDGTEHRAQRVGSRTRDVLDATVVGRKVGWILERMSGPEIAGIRIGRIEHEDRADAGHDFHFVGVPATEPGVDLDTVRDELRTLGGQGARLRIRVSAPPEQDLVFAARAVPGFGWRTYTPVPGVPTGVPVDDPTRGDVVVGEGTLDNGLVRVEIEPGGVGYSVVADGVRAEHLGRLVDGGDGGDTYNYSPPDDDLVVDGPVHTDLGVTETGPARGRLCLDQTYRWPIGAIGDERSCSRRREETCDVAVRTTLEVRTGERFVRVHTEFDNPCRDHRLRAHFPLPSRVAGSDAECAFAVVHRGLEAEGGPHEAALPTFVSRRFVDASDGAVGLALLHDGLLEYELVDDGREIALTLLRATGYLSRAEPGLRPNPAGPLDPLRGSQRLGPVACDYALMPHRGDWLAADLYARADEFLVPLVPQPVVASTRRLPRHGQALRVEGAVVSAVHRDGQGLTVRVFNPSPEPAVVRIMHEGSTARGSRVDLRGRTLASFSGSAELRAGEIVTFRLT